MWRPVAYEVDFIDEDAFNAVLSKFGHKAIARLNTLLKRMENPQHHDSRGHDYRKLQGKHAEKVSLYEVKDDYGPGYRVYFGYRNGDRVVMIAGVGTKNTQRRDISNASSTLEQWDSEQARIQRGGSQDHQSRGNQRRGTCGVC